MKTAAEIQVLFESYINSITSVISKDTHENHINKDEIFYLINDTILIDIDTCFNDFYINPVMFDDFKTKMNIKESEMESILKPMLEKHFNINIDNVIKLKAFYVVAYGDNIRKVKTQRNVSNILLMSA